MNVFGDDSKTQINNMFKFFIGLGIFFIVMFIYVILTTINQDYLIIHSIAFSFIMGILIWKLRKIQAVRKGMK